MFAENFDRIMSQKEISNYKMAKETGISASLIGYWRKGERNPSVDNLELIANYLDISIDILVKGFSEISSPPTHVNSPLENIDEVISQYRTLDDRGKIIVRAAIFNEMDRMEKKRLFQADGKK